VFVHLIINVWCLPPISSHARVFWVHVDARALHMPVRVPNDTWQKWQRVARLLFYYKENVVTSKY